MNIEDIKVGERYSLIWKAAGPVTVVAKTNARVWAGSNPDDPLTYNPNDLEPLQPTEVGRRKILAAAEGYGNRSFETCGESGGPGPYLVRMSDGTYHVEVVG